MSLCVVLAGGAATVAGCGGGDSFSQTDVRRFAGTYNGTFTGVLMAPSPGAGQTVGGTFTAVVDNQGNVTGSVTQPGVGQFPVTGTVTSDGRVNVVAQPSANQTSTLSGTAVASGGQATLSGTFTTVNSGFTVVSGTFTGTRDDD